MPFFQIEVASQPKAMVEFMDKLLNLASLSEKLRGPQSNIIIVVVVVIIYIYSFVCARLYTCTHVHHDTCM